MNNETKKKKNTGSKSKNNTVKNSNKTVKKPVEKVKTVKETKKTITKTSKDAVKKTDDVVKSPAVEVYNSNFKDSKKEVNNKKKEKLMVEENELTKLIKIVVLLVVLFLLFYGVTYLIAKIKNKNNDKKEDNKTTISIQYDEILASDILNRPNYEYFVLVKNNDDKFIDSYNTYLTTYKNNHEDALRLYTVDLTSVFNKNYKSDENSLWVENVEDLKFNSTTLLKVSDGHIVEAYDNKDSILEYLKNIM